LANAFYIPFKNSYLTQAANQVDFDLPDDIRAILVDNADYTVNLTTHDFQDDVPGAARVATAALTGESVSGATFDASDTVFTAVTGDPVESIVIYKHTGTESTSRLICYIDTATNLPVTPNGGDITIAWDNGTNKIFTL
jgi:hypothetical protein